MSPYSTFEEFENKVISKLNTFDKDIRKFSPRLMIYVRKLLDKSESSKIKGLFNLTETPLLVTVTALETHVTIAVKTQSEIHAFPSWFLHAVFDSVKFKPSNFKVHIHFRTPKICPSISLIPLNNITLGYNEIAFNCDDFGIKVKPSKGFDEFRLEAAWRALDIT